MTWPTREVSQSTLRATSYDVSSSKTGGRRLTTNPEMDWVALRRDLAGAREVQKASFPLVPPAIQGLKCVAFYRPAHGVGGDYYDFLPLHNGAWGIAIGDVSGKGIAAALVMANLQGLLRAQSLQPHCDLEVLISNVNRLVCATSPQHFFASLFYAEYHPQSRVLRYVNAGHHPPIVLRRIHNQSVLLPLMPGGVPVGLLKDSRYTSSVLQLRTDDVLVAYTDGVTEAENSERSAFGYERLERLLNSCCSQDPHEVLQLILDDMSAHSASCPQTDDVTLVVIRVEAQGEGTEHTFSSESASSGMLHNPYVD
jgi:phosphoserine phosphatase RsbU/P